MKKNLIFSKNGNMNKDFDNLIKKIYEKPNGAFAMDKVKRNSILAYIMENDIDKPPTAKEDFKWSNAFRVKKNEIEPKDAENWYMNNLTEFKEIWRTHHEGYKQLNDNPRNDFHTNFKSTCIKFIKNDMNHLKGSKLGKEIFMANWSLIKLAKKFKKIKDEYEEQMEEYEGNEKGYEDMVSKLKEENERLKTRIEKMEEGNYVDRDLYLDVCSKLQHSKELMKEKIKSNSKEVKELKEKLKIAEDEVNEFIANGYKARKKKDKALAEQLDEEEDKEE